jgi:hypothetical protein
VRATALAIVVLLVSACSSATGQSYQTTLVQPDGTYPLPIVLTDQARLVTAVEQADPPAGAGSGVEVRNGEHDPNSLIVTWLGGLCDNDVAADLWQSDSGYNLHLAFHGKLGLGCPAAGIMRAFRIKTSTPIDASTVKLTG